jgi:hypothetical protein
MEKYYHTCQCSTNEEQLHTSSTSKPLHITMKMIQKYFNFNAFNLDYANFYEQFCTSAPKEAASSLSY